jgi:NAD(P)-dependent dehydrogenase (short-subunit alcohol dehydrogenase family)
MARNIIITGGFGVLGRAVAAAFVQNGDWVARVDFAPGAPDTNANGIDLGGVDLTASDAAEAVVAKVVEARGSVDILVNIAGGFVWETLTDGDVATWQRMFAMNLVTAATATKAVLPVLGQNGPASIINIGAAAAGKADTGMGAYAASKAAVHRMTESLAAELAGKDVTVNAVLPTILDTPTNRADMPDADFSQWVSPDAVAQVILFLASPASRCITGALIPVNRGS